MQHTVLASADRELGKLRTYLLRVFQRYIRDVRAHENAQKRGGGVQVFSLNIEEGEDMALVDLAGSETPEMLYDRAWARSVLRCAFQHLGVIEQAAGRGRLFAALEHHLNPDVEPGAGHAEATTDLGMSAEALRQAVSRLRKKFRDCLRESIAATLHEPDAARIDEELQALKAALRQ